MKTTWITSKPGSLYPWVMAAVMVLACFGCEKTTDPLIFDDKDLYSKTDLSGFEDFWIYPAESKYVEVLGGTVYLEFPEGTVSEPTLFSIRSFPLNNMELDGFNVMERGILLFNIDNFQELPDNSIPLDNPPNMMDRENILSNIDNSQKLMTRKVRITMKYDMEKFKQGAPENEDNLTIYQVQPGNLDACGKIKSIGECCVDCSCTTIIGCICNCGLYVVGEK